MISIIIPARNEPYLVKTVDDLLAKAQGEIEIIVVLDGYWPDPMPTIPLPYGETPLDPPSKKVIILHRGLARGMRPAINSAVEIARGEHILKCDAHCMFDVGYDTKLVADCEDNWISVPRRKRLLPDTWSILEDGRPDIDYEYMCYPYRKGELVGLHGLIWDEKNKDKSLKDDLIVDLMAAQGSCWFMHRSYYKELELLDDINYGTFFAEFQEIALKCWLSGGRIVRNKKTWYAHWYKGKHRGYSLHQDVYVPRNYTMKWLNFQEAWPKQTLPLEWLIEKFSPVPGWAEKSEIGDEISQCE
jgi:glycosyltransferase involved in cell wall biosynthesis